MNKLPKALGLFLLILACWPAAAVADSQENSPTAGRELLAEEINRREQLAQEISAKHVLARLEADELIAQHRFGQARYALRQVQKLLASKRNEIPPGTFTMLDTLGQEKLKEIDRREILYLRERLASQQPQPVEQKKSSTPELPVPAASPAGSAADVSRNPSPVGIPDHQPTRYLTKPIRLGLGTLVQNVEYEEIPLNEVLDDLRDKSGANIVANWQSLSKAGIEKDTPVSLKLRNVSAGRILKAILENLSSARDRVSYIVQDGVVLIATAEDLDRRVDTRTYDITHLLMEVKDLRGGSRYDSGSGQYDRRRDRNMDYDNRNRDRRSNSSRTSVGSSSRRSSESTAVDRKQKIIDIVYSSAPEDSWRENGGPGSVAVFGTRLIVTQTIENHTKIAMAIAMLGG